jgi:DnaJ-class molecular chaperone
MKRCNECRDRGELVYNKGRKRDKTRHTCPLCGGKKDIRAVKCGECLKANRYGGNGNVRRTDMSVDVFVVDYVVSGVNGGVETVVETVKETVNQ